MRGEHNGTFSWAPQEAGSSPHARGAQFGQASHDAAPGIIPACAGSTASFVGRFPCGGDHPRMRGEHARRARATVSQTGSSPHARGALGHGAVRKAAQGIIPACAGSTTRGSRRSWTRRDHPRMRGEHPSSHVASSPTLGSSPHARGARAGRARQAKQEGIIPACAGSTGVRMKVKHGERDHPRMRGEHAAGAPPGPECWGSSPHARGAQSASHGVAHEQGIIPACAGSTP